MLSKIVELSIEDVKISLESLGATVQICEDIAVIDMPDGSTIEYTDFSERELLDLLKSAVLEIFGINSVETKNV